MTILFNGARSAYTATDLSMGQNFGAPVIVGIIFNPTQENNRRLLGQAYLYRRIVDPAVTEWLAIEAYELRQRRNGVRFTFGLVATDIIRVIPFYDIPQMVVVVQQSGA